ncbi:hypothetical protein PTSG_09538 [Salpingoeca rosetta]|uniref:Uncharacterized protein n=1 Tax=Salpingoeca rosetta (strain ATCC 50818 / BSB-021) TaxID=946362 RepID=F2ULA4_SALR5|nr:uncharacterized protein PTSG_09538 [Salpingoeca rosetta]EGD77903.1 hypothetical protein PTSG_09538 [Salpingoeca rosetta]|eukprot:XP_004989967.1 hypothetical protein PTSG_09538 [Salpingoeca rosetta]
MEEKASTAVVVIENSTPKQVRTLLGQQAVPESAVSANARGTVCFVRANSTEEGLTFMQKLCFRPGMQSGTWIVAYALVLGKAENVLWLHGVPVGASLANHRNMFVHFSNFGGIIRFTLSPASRDGCRSVRIHYRTHAAKVAAKQWLKDHEGLWKQYAKKGQWPATGSASNSRRSSTSTAAARPITRANAVAPRPPLQPLPPAASLLSPPESQQETQDDASQVTFTPTATASTSSNTGTAGSGGGVRALRKVVQPRRRDDDDDDGDDGNDDDDHDDGSDDDDDVGNRHKGYDEDDDDNDDADDDDDAGALQLHGLHTGSGVGPVRAVPVKAVKAVKKTPEQQEQQSQQSQSQSHTFTDELFRELMAEGDTEQKAEGKGEGQETEPGEDAHVAQHGEGTTAAQQRQQAMQKRGPEQAGKSTDGDAVEGAQHPTPATQLAIASMSAEIPTAATAAAVSTAAATPAAGASVPQTSTVATTDPIQSMLGSSHSFADVLTALTSSLQAAVDGLHPGCSSLAPDHPAHKYTRAQTFAETVTCTHCMRAPVEWICSCRTQVCTACASKQQQLKRT